jgi:hypothetical protein
MGPEFLEEDVGRDFEEDVGHEEDDEAVAVLERGQMEVLGETKDGGVGDVDSVDSSVRESVRANKTARRMEWT